MVTTCRWEPPHALESLPDPTPSPSSGFPSAVDIRYTQGKKGAKSENTHMEASQGTRRPPTATPPCRETDDIRYTKEKKAQKVITPLRPHRKPPRACGGSQQRHPSSGLPSRSHQTNCEGSHVDNPGVQKGPKRSFRRPSSKDYERGWVQGFEGTPETGGALDHRNKREHPQETYRSKEKPCQQEAIFHPRPSRRYIRAGWDSERQ